MNPSSGPMTPFFVAGIFVYCLLSWVWVGGGIASEQKVAL